MSKAITIRAADEQKDSWSAAAHREQMSLSAWMRRALDDRAAGTMPDTPESVTVKAQRAREIMEQAAELTGRGGGAAERGEPSAAGPGPSTEPPAAEAQPEGPPPEAEAPPPPPPSPPPSPRSSVDRILGTQKRGTVTGAQSIKAIEAQRRIDEQADFFSMTCPKRAEHIPGQRCPQCKGIHP